MGVLTKDLVCSSSLRSAGRLFRWLSALRLSPRLLLPLQQGLITARIDTRMRIMRSITFDGILQSATTMPTAMTRKPCTARASSAAWR